jgi:hypothetical protein
MKAASGVPHLVGRFQALDAIADSYGLRRPTVLVTEFGWATRTCPRFRPSGVSQPLGVVGAEGAGRTDLP